MARNKGSEAARQMREMNNVGRPWAKGAKKLGGKFRKLKAEKRALNGQNRVVETGELGEDFIAFEPELERKKKEIVRKSGQGRYFDSSPDENLVKVKSLNTQRDETEELGLVGSMESTVGSTKASDEPRDPSSPWLPVHLIPSLPRDPASVLSLELPSFTRFILPNESEHLIRTTALERLRETVSRAKPGWNVEAGGSWVSGTGSWDGDLDCVMLASDSLFSSDSTSEPDEDEEMPPKSHQNRNLGKVMKHLFKTHPLFLVRRARVPVLKLRDPDSGLDIDLTAAGPGLVRSAKFARRLGEHREHLKEIVVLLKRVLKEAEMNEPFKGGLGGYPATIVVAWWLDWRTRYVRPGAGMGLGESVTEFFRQMAGISAKKEEMERLEMSEDPAPVLTGLLRTHSFSLEPRAPFRAITTPLNLPRPPSTPRTMDVRDPLDRANNTARAFVLLPSFRRLCAEVYVKLIKEGPGSVLARIVDVQAERELVAKPFMTGQENEEEPRSGKRAKRPRMDDPPAYNPRAEFAARQPKKRSPRTTFANHEREFADRMVKVTNPWMDEADVEIGKRFTGWRGEEETFMISGGDLRPEYEASTRKKGPVRPAKGTKPRRSRDETWEEDFIALSPKKQKGSPHRHTKSGKLKKKKGKKVKAKKGENGQGLE
jgi:hypothetical protein